jgi:hypothetical protein
MSSGFYREYLLIWRARHDKEMESWIPEINISWKINAKTQFHTMKRLPRISEAEAWVIGDELAKAWVDRNL